MLTAKGGDLDVFAYGSLMSESVLQVLLQRLPTMRPAVLRGFRRYKLDGRSYPAVAPHLPSDAVCGVLLCNLSAAEVATLNAFEDPVYERRLVPVWLTDIPSSSAVEALAYVQANDEGPMLIRDWSLGEFESSPLYPEYLERCREFRSNYVAKK